MLLLGFGAPDESTLVLDVLLPSPFSLLSWADDRGDAELFGERSVDGRMSFFCLEAGRISSKSTGTPRLTRKRRRMRERIQLGGAKGGGATSWAQREALRSDRKGVFAGVANGVGKLEISIVSAGNIAST